MPKRTKNYNSWFFEQLVDPQVAANYINAAIEDSPEMLRVALRNVAEAHKMAKVAEDAGVNRESLYRALSTDGNPTLSTLNAVLSALGLRILVEELREKNTAEAPEKEQSTASIVRASSDIESQFRPTTTFTGIGHIISYTTTTEPKRISRKLDDEVSVNLLINETQNLDSFLDEMAVREATR